VATWAGARLVARMARGATRWLPRRRFEQVARERRDQVTRPRMPRAG
jgi:hypothetical protein